jgi:hypothetical protein
MKTVGKILLFIGGLLFFISAVLEIVGVVTILVQDKAQFFGTDPLYVGILAFVIVVLWIILDLAGGWSGMTYAIAGKNVGWVKILSFIIVLLLVINVVGVIVNEVKSKTVTWTDWSSVVYGGIAGIVYVLGYLLDSKKKA